MALLPVELGRGRSSENDSTFPPLQTAAAGFLNRSADSSFVSLRYVPFVFGNVHFPLLHNKQSCVTMDHQANIGRPELIAIIVKAVIIGGISFFALKYTMDALDPTRKQKKEAHEKVSPCFPSNVN